MTEAHRRVAADATGQLGAFSRKQAHAAGLTDGQLRRRVQSGVLEPIGPNAFRSAFTPRGALADLAALMLERHRNVRRVGVVIHTSNDLPLIDRARAQGLAVLSGARTVIDLCRTAGPEALTRAVDSGLRDGRFNEDLLHRRIVALRSKGRYGLPKLLDVLAGVDATRGGHSWLERRYLALLADAGLPRPQTQQVLAKAGDRLVRVDCRFAGTPVVVELLGYRFHASGAQLTRDAARLNALLLAGHAPYQFTYAQVTECPHDVVRITREALRVHAPSASA